MDARESCNECGAKQAKCSFCEETARYFLEARVHTHEPETERVAATIYFCDSHADLILSEEARDGDTDVEVGLYCATPDCPGCDSWA